MICLRTWRGKQHRRETDKWITEEWLRVEREKDRARLREIGEKLAIGWHECEATGCTKLVKNPRMRFCRDRNCPRHHVAYSNAEMAEYFAAKARQEELDGLIAEQAEELRNPYEIQQHMHGRPVSKKTVASLDERWISRGPSRHGMDKGSWLDRIAA